MEQFIIFLKGLLTILVGGAGVITCIGSFVTKQPFFIACGIITLPFIVYYLIKYLKEHFSNTVKKDVL